MERKSRESGKASGEGDEMLTLEAGGKKNGNDAGACIFFRQKRGGMQRALSAHALTLLLEIGAAPSESAQVSPLEG